MSIISIEMLTKENSYDVYTFEKDNKAYFEKTLPPRHNDYYTLNGFNNIINTLLLEQKNKDVFMHLIRDINGVMVGRINLITLENDKKIAEIGYRIGENYNNKGYASEAVKMSLDRGLNLYGLDKIIAGTATDNFASKKVLIKNGFSSMKVIEKDVKVNNKWIDTEIFEIKKSYF